MGLEVITKEDLQQFRAQLINDLRADSQRSQIGQTVA